MYVNVDTYKNEVQHNVGHMGLYMAVRTVDLHENYDRVPTYKQI
jgi:hypothetical protein